MLKPDEFRTTTIDDIVISPVVQQLEHKLEEYELGGYEHYMLKEIFEQPAALRNWKVSAPVSNCEFLGEISHAALLDQMRSASIFVSPALYEPFGLSVLEAAGAVQPIKVDGRAIALMPYNPAQRAAEQQEIAMAVHGLQLCGQFFPEEFKMWVDGKGTMDNLLAKLRVELVKMRDPDQVQQAVEGIGKLMGGTPPGGVVKGPAPPQPGPSGLPVPQ